MAMPTHAEAEYELFNSVAKTPEMGRVRVATLSRYLNPLIMKSGSKLPSRRLPMGYTNKSRRAVDCLFAILHQHRSRISIYQVQMLVNPRHRGCSHTLLTSNNSTLPWIPLICINHQQATPTPPQFHSGPSGHSYTFPSSSST